MTVSAVALGTVSLGVDYGIAAPGEFGRPDEADAVRLIATAVDRGITLIDTAPAYGASEHIVGRALGSSSTVTVATKVHTPPLQSSSADFHAAVDASLGASARALARDPIDVVQIHNATVESIRDGRITEALANAQQRGRVRFLGASVYGEEAAMAVIESGAYDVLQIALNALDQRMMTRVLPAADRAGVAVLVRSAFLKGALTPKAQWLPDALAPLRAAAARARDLLAGGSWEQLPHAAMRFCLSIEGIASVLTGARTAGELDAAFAAEAEGPLPASVLDNARTLALDDERMVNPSHWPIA